MMRILIVSLAEPITLIYFSFLYLNYSNSDAWFRIQNDNLEKRIKLAALNMLDFNKYIRESNSPSSRISYILIH